MQPPFDNPIETSISITLNLENSTPSIAVLEATNTAYSWKFPRQGPFSITGLSRLTLGKVDFTFEYADETIQGVSPP